MAELEAYRDTPRSRKNMLVNNLSRYFAVYQVPSNLEEVERLLGSSQRITRRFAEQLFRRAAERATERGGTPITDTPDTGTQVTGPLVTGPDMQAALDELLPSRPTPYDELIFFPQAASGEQVVIETYDLDAYRDTGVVWEVLLDLGQTLETNTGSPQPDLEATVLLARGVISYGLLVLRLGGQLAKEELAVQLLSHQLRDAAKVVAQRAQARSAAEDPPLTPGSVFVDVTAASGIRFRHVSSRWISQLRRYLPRTTTFGGGGVAAADIDGDGWPDLVVCGGRGCSTFRNEQDGTFSDITQASGLNVPGEARMPLPADFDNDGDQDIYITYARDSNHLFENRGDGTFVDITGAAGLELEGGVSGSAIAVDVDRDGLLDLYVGNFGDYLKGEVACCGKDATNGLPNRLYRNLGGLRFADVSESAGIGNSGWAQAVSHADVDRDGDQDIYIANDFGRNDLLLNNGDGTFASVGAAAAADGFFHGMNVSFADLNSDQLADIFITNIWHWHPVPRKATETNTLLLSQPGAAVRYQRHEDPAFVDHDTGWSWAGLFLDFDNDADDDLFIANGFNGYFTATQHRPHPERPEDLYPINNSYESNFLLRNDSGIPTEVVADFGAELGDVNSRSAALLDYDRDGDLDLALTTFHSDFHLFQNIGAVAANGWLVVELVGDPAQNSNLDAIGAQLVARTSEGAVIWRTVTGGEGYIARGTPAVEIGLGSATTVDLEIDWPGGQREIRNGIGANQAIRIRQGRTEIETLWSD